MSSQRLTLFSFRAMLTSSRLVFRTTDTPDLKLTFRFEDPATHDRIKALTSVTPKGLEADALTVKIPSYVDSPVMTQTPRLVKGAAVLVTVTVAPRGEVSLEEVAGGSHGQDRYFTRV